MADPAFAPLSSNSHAAYSPVSLAGADLSVITEVEILAINFGADAEKPLAKKLGSLPSPGQSASFDKSRLLWTEVGQLFCVTEGIALGEAALGKMLGDTGYVTDLTDGWIAARLSGPRALALLDQLVMPDLSADTFAIGDVTSTSFAQLRVIIWRNGKDEVTALSASSSARSFWHALQDELKTTSSYQDLSDA